MEEKKTVDQIEQLILKAEQHYKNREQDLFFKTADATMELVRKEYGPASKQYAYNLTNFIAFHLKIPFSNFDAFCKKWVDYDNHSKEYEQVWCALEQRTAPSAHDTIEENREKLARKISYLKILVEIDPDEYGTALTHWLNVQKEVNS